MRHSKESLISCFVIATAVALCSSLDVSGQEVESAKWELQLDYEHIRFAEAALAEFRKQSMDLKEYRLSMYRQGNGYLAIFEDSSVSPDRRGASPRIPSFEIEFDSDLNVTRSNFVR